MNRLEDTQVCIGTLLSGACWVIGMGLIAGCCTEWLPHPYAALGLAVIIGGALRTVCALLHEQIRRERMLFEMGRDSVRDHVRVLRE